MVRDLHSRGLEFREVNRQPLKQHPNQWKADIRNPTELDAVVQGSTHTYLCVGLPYKTSLWQSQWIPIMENVIEACERHQSRLIFLDNIYLYGHPLPAPFDERTLQTPHSRKGGVRKKVADLLVRAMQEGRVQGVIGRSADFYGPGALNSVLYIQFLQNMLEGKAAQTLYPQDIPHTYADVDDVGRALVALALNEDCHGQAWHLPVGEPTSFREMHEHFNLLLGTRLKLKTMPEFLQGLLAPFVSVLRETAEMSYQFKRDYLMSFEKFRRRFPDFRVSTVEESARGMVESFKVR